MKLYFAISLSAIVLLTFALAEGGEIHDAAMIDDLTTIKDLVEKNPDLVTTRDRDRRTALHLAARYGDKDTVVYLISKGADVNAICYNQFTPLHLTSDPKIAKILIENGADLKAEAAGGTPLQTAVSNENFAIIDLLVEAGEKLDLESLVRLGKTKQVAEILEAQPWMAKAPRKVLHTACWHGHLEISRMLLKNGADPNLDFGFSNVSGVYSPLSSAVTNGHLEVAKLLCEHEAEMNVAGGKLYDNLFHYVVAHRDARYVKLMLEHGADVHATNHTSAMTPLHVAANIGDAEKASLILKFKADVNARTRDGATPLMFAATWGHEAVSQLLLKEGAKLDIHVATALGRRADVERFLQDDPDAVNHEDKRLRRTPLFWAAHRGHADLVKLLLDSGADVNAKAPHYGQASNVVTGPQIWRRYEKKEARETPLHVAAVGENVRIVQLLLDAGAAVDAQDEDGMTALHKAVYGGRVANVSLLVRRGAKVDSVSQQGSPLTGAYDKPEIMKILLLTTTPSQSSLDKALSSAADNKDVAQLLLKAGAQADIYAASTLGLAERVRELLKADPTLANKLQRGYPRARSINLAASNGHLEVVRILIENGAELHPKDGTSALAAAAGGGNIDVVKLLLERGADVNHKDSMGSTALHSAADAGELEIVRLLLKSGANLRETDVYRSSALHESATAGHTEVLAFLIAAGISVEVRNDFAETPLHKAVLYGHVDAARVLIEEGANVNAKNQRGQTPLAYAERDRERYFHDELDLKPLAELLRKHGGEK